MRSIVVPDDPLTSVYGIDAAREYSLPATRLEVAGRCGHHDHSAEEQLRGALDSLERVLTLAGYDVHDVVRLGIFTTDVESILANWALIRHRFAPGTVPPHSLLEVTRFAHPNITVEIEASASRSELR